MKNILILCVLFSTSAFAGHVTGNGGDAIVCRDRNDNVTHAELLDFYEARVERQFPHDLIPTKTWQENLQILLNRFSHYDIHPRSVVEPWRDSFMSEVLLLPGITLVDIPDSEHVSFPRGCKVEQVAIQKEPKFAGDKRYTINKDIWDAFDGASRAGLIFHEILYRNLLTSKLIKRSIDSRAVRFMTSILAAGRFDILTYPTYLKLMYEDLGFGFTNVEGFTVPIESVKFDNQYRVIAFKGFMEQETMVNVTNGTKIQAAMGDSLDVSHDFQTGQRTYRIQVAKAMGSFTVNGILFTVIAPIQIVVDREGHIQNLSGVTFKWKSYYWTQARDIKCMNIALNPGPRGGITCQGTKVSLQIDSAVENYTEIVFTADLKIMTGSARIEHTNALAQTVNLEFYPETQVLKSVVCSGAPNSQFFKTLQWIFHYEDSTQSLSCYAGDGDIQFYPNGKVKKGGVLQRRVSLGLSTLHSRYGFGCRKGEREWFTSPIYLGYESGSPANALIVENSPTVTAKDINGQPVEIKAGDYLTLAEDGAVASVERNYCAN